MAQSNPFSHLIKELNVDGVKYKYFSLTDLKDPRVDRLPFTIRVLLECAIRNCDEFVFTKQDVENILNWQENYSKDIEIPFKPARVLMQDFTGVPGVVDLAAMRDAVKRLGGDPSKINPLVPVDLVIDHSVQVDVSRTPDALEKNQEKEFERNYERFKFLKWGSTAFDNLTIVPPGSGIVHQVNLEYLARVVFCDNDNVLYPDSLVGTDSHTTMINGLGVLGWGCGGIEAEASMLGQALSMVLPKVVGVRLTGSLSQQATATDLVLTITQMLRSHGVVEKFVEFYGPGCDSLSIADRATLGNMSPEYGATCGLFPVDGQTLKYLKQTARDSSRLNCIEAYLRAQSLFRTLDTENAVYSEHLELDLSTVVPCIAGPKRPHDRIALSNVKKDFQACMNAKRGFKGFGIAPENLSKEVSFTFQDKEYKLRHGDVVIAAITSCTNTSNPSVMLGAGMVAKKAVEAGLNTLPYVKTSLSPGSGVVTEYLKQSGVLPFLEQLGFNLAGYGCQTCIGNSGELFEPLDKVIIENDLVVAAVLSGNRNFEARVHPLTQGNYLASPPLVVAYALAGTVNIDFEHEPIGTGHGGKSVFLRDIWPTRDEIEAVIDKVVMPSMFKEVYERIKQGTPRWNALEAPTGKLYPWDEESTYIHNPPFFTTMGLEPPGIYSIQDAYVLLNLGDSITTDHISPAGSISRSSCAARYLMERGVKPQDFNTYGSRRGNDEVMARGTFANTRLINKFLPQPGPKTVFQPTGEVMDIFDAAQRYFKMGSPPVIVFGGADYGSGSSRDWAAKGPHLLGVKAVIAVSFERIHRSNLVGMGIIPLVFMPGEDLETLGLTGKERYSINIPANPTPRQEITIRTDTGKEFKTILRINTDVEMQYVKHGGILNYVLRQLVKH